MDLDYNEKYHGGKRVSVTKLADIVGIPKEKLRTWCEAYSGRDVRGYIVHRDYAPWLKSSSTYLDVIEQCLEIAGCRYARQMYGDHIGDRIAVYVSYFKAKSWHWEERRLDVIYE